MATQTALLDIPLDRLDPDPENPRGELKGIPELAASITANGVLEPLRVRSSETPERYTVVFGHRRRAAAIEAKLVHVPCVLVNDGDAKVRATTRLVENLQRVDLTAAETATGVQQLLDLGLDAGSIKAETGLASTVVESAVTLAGSKVARGLAERHDMTMDQALVFAEFESDKEALKRLNATLSKDPSRWDHTVERLRQDREEAIEVQKLTDKLTRQNVTIMENRPGYSDKKVVALDHLRASKDTTEGVQLNAQTHKKCPGHAAYIERPGWGKPKIVYYCTDVPGNGHVSLWGGPSKQRAADLPEKEREQVSQERKQVIAGNKAWKAALVVRDAYITQLMKRATPPKGTLRFAVEAVLAGSTQGSWRLTDPPHYTEKKLPLGLFKHVSEYEEELLTNPHSWRAPHDNAVRYLRFLESTGYALSLVEQVVVGDAKVTALTEPVKED